MRMPHPSLALMITCSLALLPTASQAGFADSLRSLRDTVNQITYTTSDVKSMSQEVGDFVGIKNLPTQPQVVTANTGTTLVSGQVMSTKINTVSLYQTADKTSAVLQKLPKGSEVVFSGAVKNGLYLVTTEFGEGWVDANLVY